eukprot:scaffold12881_cov177-Amphora_coffeaeformis.AAC.3
MAVDTRESDASDNNDASCSHKLHSPFILKCQHRETYDACQSHKRPIVATLWRLSAPTFIPSALCQLVTVICQVAVPLLVREVLRILEDRPNEKVIKEGLPYSLALFAALFVNAFGNHRHRHLAMKTGVILRGALINVLYGHVLRLTPQGRAGLTTGEVTTLVAVDTQKLYEVTQEANMIWSLPLSVLLVTVFLMAIMGPVTLIGIFILLLFVPMASFVTNKMLQVRQERVKVTDKRIEIASNMLQGMKTAKLNNYEKNYLDKATAVRNEELRLLRKELAIWAVTLVMTVISPVLATAGTFSAYVLISEDNILTAAKTFSVLLLFTALRFPVSYAGRLLGKAAQALSALDRIEEFLKREVRNVPAITGEQEIAKEQKAAEKTTCANAQTPLVVENASFLIGSDNMDPVEAPLSSSRRGGSFTVSGFDFSVNIGEVLAVCGPVGSGKSSLIYGLIQEASPVSEETKVSTWGTVAYVPQTPFILNTTVRENILFGLPFDQGLYDRVLDACSLRSDILQLGESGDLTEIGERGVTLSGGQKQRVSLARAAYSRPDVVLLDDPLSALDAGTSKLVFENLIRGSNAVFSTAAVVLVTHASHFLNRVDKILVVVGGTNKFYDTWENLGSFEPCDAETTLAVEHIKNSVQEVDSETEEKGDAYEEQVTANRKVYEKKDALMTEEDKEQGLSSLKTWLLWFKHAGGFFFIGIQAFLMTVDRFAYVAVEFWLAKWTSGAYESTDMMGVTFEPQSNGRSAQLKYLVVYCLLLAVSVTSTVMRSEWSVTGGSRAATSVFHAMLVSVLKAPMSYFETTPMGRVLNRFTYDTEVVDILLTEAMSIFMISISWFVAGIIVMSTILPWTLFALVPIIGLYSALLYYYRMTGTDMQRLDAKARSPIQAMVSEVLEGCSSIRVFQREKTFIERFRGAADNSSSALFNFVTAQRWLGVRIEVLGAVVVLTCTLLVISLNDKLRLEPGIVGLLIIWSSNFTITLGFLMDFFSETESAITGIERVDAMSRLPMEKPMETGKSIALPLSWPESGNLEFDNVCLRYRPGLPLALNSLSFTIPPGKSCGVVGRTGAGKSSLTVALFRLVEIESGVVRLDGQNLGDLGLSDVRGRPNGLSIIPQDPFLTGSTLREVIDPFGYAGEADILEALKAVRIANETDSEAILDQPVEEGGSNYSVGERQLLNLARALLSRPKVLVLDEATASVDGETDAFIQKMLRTRFKDTTLLTIAHRLHTIMDYDLVLVMDAGRAVEFGSPQDLLEEAGIFAELVDATGLEGSKALRAMVLTDQ